MKKTLSILAILITSYAASAQTNIFPSTGNVGIGTGTTTPEQRLTVVMNGSENGSGIAVKAINNGGAGSQPAYTFLNPLGSKRMYSYLDVSSDTYNIGNTIGTPLLTINQEGNIGIGTVAPEQRLTIVMNGSENGSGIAIKAVNSGAAGSQPSYTFLNPLGIKRMYSYLDVSSDTYNIGNATGDALLTIKQAGNVGIGTATPDAKLAVAGIIHSKEVKVDMNGWPDYVFRPNYVLPSLLSVKTYIDKNHHLPEMPTDEEVAKDGIKLGEIVKLQTKKIEELTLYLLDQQKQINELKQQLSGKK